MLCAISGTALILVINPILPVWGAPKDASPGSAQSTNISATWDSGFTPLTSMYNEDGKHDDEHGDHGEAKDHDTKTKDHDDANKGGNHHEHPPDNSGHDAPSALSQTVATEEDTLVEIVLSESTDDKRDTISFSIVDEPQYGEIQELEGMNDTVAYLPSANFFGTDSFTFKVSDGIRESPTATVTINVSAVNDPPVANGAQVSTSEGRSLVLVLNASDVDNDELQYEITSGPAHGIFAGIAPNLSYEPATNFHGSDAVSFKANDGSVDSNVATVAITVTSTEKKNENRNEAHWWEDAPSVTATASEATPAAINEVSMSSADEVEAVGTQVYQTALAIDSPDTQNSIIDGADDQNVIQDISFAQVKDALAPRLLFPAKTLEAIATSVAGAVVTYTVKAVDDSDGEIEASCSPTSGYTFHVGKYNVVCRATDAVGNTALGSFVVIVHQAASAPAGSSYSFLLPMGLMGVLGVGAFMTFLALKRARIM